MSLNHITIMGRLVRDPECRRTGSGTAVTSFTVAVERDIAPNGQEKETDFIDVVAWRNLGEFVHNYFSKGRMIVVSGRLQIRTWKDKDGNNRRTAEVVADHCYFGDSKSDGSQGNHGGYSAPAPNSYGSSATGGSYPNPSATDRNAGYGNNYGTGGQYGGYGGGYAAPAGGDQYSANNFDMLEGEDGQLPF